MLAGVHRQVSAASVMTEIEQLFLVETLVRLCLAEDPTYEETREVLMKRGA